MPEFGLEEIQIAPDQIASEKERAYNIIPIRDSNWTFLPYELWLTILVDYGLTSKDFAMLDLCCRWFSIPIGGMSATEESARLVIRRRKLPIFVMGHSWKETLHTVEMMERNTHKMAAGSYQNIFTANGHLMTWGAGKFGQLGNGRWDDSVQLQEIRHLVPAESGEPSQVSAGCGHSGFVTTKGHAFTCGDNRYGQLGQCEFTGQTCATPTRVYKGLNNKRCLQIACGSSHTLFLTDTGEVFVAGLGDSGQLGLKCRKAMSQHPTLVSFQYDAYTIVQITAGIAHNIFVTDCGKAFTFGLGSTGQLGHGGTKNISKPTLVSVLRDRTIRFAAAGVSHSIFVDSKGGVYTCGQGHGLLGHGDTRIRTTPTLVRSLEGVNIVSAAAGVTQSIFISDEGIGYWCGEGMGELKHHVATLPTRMDLPEPLVKASIGNSHTILLMQSGLLMSMGNNGRYQTGIATPQTSTPVINYTYIH